MTLFIIILFSLSFITVVREDSSYTLYDIESSYSGDLKPTAHQYEPDVNAERVS